MNKNLKNWQVILIILVLISILIYILGIFIIKSSYIHSKYPMFGSSGNKYIVISTLMYSLLLVLPILLLIFSEYKYLRIISLIVLVIFILFLTTGLITSSYHNLMSNRISYEESDSKNLFLQTFSYLYFSPIRIPGSLYFLWILLPHDATW